jgi:hypothetical protein
MDFKSAFFFQGQHFGMLVLPILDTNFFSSEMGKSIAPPWLMLLVVCGGMIISFCHTIFEK